MLPVPSQTLIALQVNELPLLLHGTLVFVVADDLVWTGKAVERYRFEGKNGFKVVMVAKAKDPQSDFKSMKALFANMWLSGLAQSVLLLVSDASSIIYTYLPYKSASSCEDTTPVL